MSIAQSEDTIAIVGGGIGGLCLAVALHNTGRNITIYEAAASFTEIGAGVMFAANAVKAIGLIDPRLEAALQRIAGRDKDRASESKSSLTFRHAYHSLFTSTSELEYIGEANDPTDNLVPVSRSAFLDELVRLIPSGVAHFHKRLVSIHDEGSSFKLMFKDGTVAYHTIVLGADGIHSPTREFVLGRNAPGSNPDFSGFCGYRGRVSMDKATQILGETVASSYTMFLGEGSHIACYPADNGRFVNLTLMGKREVWKHGEQWVIPSNREALRKMYQHWPQKMIALTDEVDASEIRALFHLPNVPRYYRKQIAIIGDAAHATTPFQGTGAGMAIVDAYILSQLLKQAGDLSDSRQVEAALVAYDAVRRPFTQKVVKTSYEAGRLWNYDAPDIGCDIKKIAENVSTRYQWIWNEDLLRQVQHGKEIMEQRLAGVQCDS